MSSNILDDMFVTDIKSTIKKLHRRHTRKDCKKETPGEPGVYLVKYRSKVDGSTYLINCCFSMEARGILGESRTITSHAGARCRYMRCTDEH